jgi:hypothetical protein
MKSRFPSNQAMQPTALPGTALPLVRDLSYHSFQFSRGEGRS